MNFSRGFWIVTLALGFYFFSVQMTFPLIPVFITNELEASESFVGASVLIVAIFSVGTRIPAGTWSDRFGRRPLMLVGGVLGVIFPFSMTISFTIPFFILSRIVFGFAIGIFLTGVKAYVADIVPPEQRGEAFGINTSAFAVALILGPLTGEGLKNAFDFRVAFLAGAVMSIIALVLIYLLPRNEKPTSSGVSMVQGIGDVLRLRGAWAALMITLSGTAIFPVIFVYFPIQIERFELDTDAPALIQNVTISVAFSIYALINLLMLPRFGRYSDRRGRTAALIPGLLILLPGLILLWQARNLWVAYLGIAIMAVGVSSLRAMMDALMQDACPPMLRGTGTAVLYTFWDGGIGILSQVQGTALDQSGFDMMFIIVIIAAVLFGVWGIWLSYQVSRERMTSYKLDFPSIPTR